MPRNAAGKVIGSGPNHRAKNEFGLNPRQEIFCREYVASLNATRSYMKAYGAKLTTATVQGSLLLIHPKAKERIQKLLKEENERLHVTKDKIIRELARSGMQIDPLSIGAKWADKNKALEILAKLNGQPWTGLLREEKQNVNVSMGVGALESSLRTLSDADLDGRIKELQDRINACTNRTPEKAV